MKIRTLRRNKEKEDSSQNAPTDTVIPTRLQEIVGNDTELYRAMSRVMFLDPKRITTQLEQAVRQASEHESTGNKIRSEVWYRIAGGIALYKGDAEGVRKFFQKALLVSGQDRKEYKTVSEQPERAVEISRKYYENL
jgi:hypothetical protein